MTEKRRYYALIGLMIVSVAPLVFALKLPAVWDMRSIALYASAFAGYTGMILLLWMYILGAKSVIGLFLADVPKVFRLHNWLGKYGTLLIFVHPILVAISYGENLIRYSLVPSLANSFETSVTYGRIALFGLLVVWLTSAIVRGMIAYRPWRYVHYLAYSALPLSLLHVPTVGSSYQSMLLARIYYVSMLILFVLFALVRVRHLFGLGKRAYVIVQHQEIAPDVFAVRLRQPVGNNIRVSKGQYVYLQVNLLGEEHPFSVLHQDAQSGDITIAYKVYGRFTRKFSLLPKQTTIFVDGPYGRFTEEIAARSDPPAIFIAAGIGVAPFMSHIMENVSREQWFFYANRTHDSAVFADLIKQKFGSRYVGVLSRQRDGAQRNDERGHISAGLIKSYIGHPNQYHYYICGPAAMIKTTVGALRSLNVPQRQVHVEEFSF